MQILAEPPQDCTASNEILDAFAAAYMVARQDGSDQEEAAAAAGRYMAEVKQVVPPA